MIELQNVCKRYRVKTGWHTVLDNVNLKIEEGKSIGILGVNGAGKSTMIRIIGGAERPDSGRVVRTSRVSWPIGFAGCFHGSLSGRENLRFVSSSMERISARSPSMWKALPSLATTWTCP